jgi:hypothetical protein
MCNEREIKIGNVYMCDFTGSNIITFRPNLLVDHIQKYYAWALRNLIDRPARHNSTTTSYFLNIHDTIDSGTSQLKKCIEIHNKKCSVLHNTLNIQEPYMPFDENLTIDNLYKLINPDADSYANEIAQIPSIEEQINNCLAQNNC